MSNARHFQPTLSQLPLVQRALYTGALLVLAMGYLFAMTYVYSAHAGRDGDKMLTEKDLEIAYAGKKGETTLESALKGPMTNMLPDDEKQQIFAWIRAGADKKDYDSNIKPIIEKRCTTCHTAKNPNLPNLAGFKNVVAQAQEDHGTDIFSLVRVSHIHLFGLTFIFFIVGAVFAHARFRPEWLKVVIVAAPFFSIMIDIMSWYLTKLYPPLAWLVMISGAIMATCFAIQFLVSLYQMWLGRRAPEDEAAFG